MDIKKEREAFDVWYYEHQTNVGYDEMFGSWLAAKQQAIPDGFVVVPVEPTYGMWSKLSRHLGRYMQSHDRYCPKTLKKYFDRFIGEPPEWMLKEVGDWDSDHAFATADLPVFIYKAMIQEAQK